MLFGEGHPRECLEGVETQECISPRPWCKSGARDKGDGFLDGMKPLKHRYQALIEFDEKVQERRGEGKPSFDHLKGEKRCREKPMSVRS